MLVKKNTLNDPTNTAMHAYAFIDTHDKWAKQSYYFCIRYYR